MTKMLKTLLVLTVACTVVISIMLFRQEHDEAPQAMTTSTPVCGTWHIISAKELGLNLASVDFSVLGFLTKDYLWVGGLSRDPLGHIDARFEVWNGNKWYEVPGPELKIDQGELKALSVTTVDNAWAVGYGVKDQQPQLITMHWDGKSWSSQPVSSTNIITSAPPVNGGAGKYPSLNDVSIIAVDDVWAVGKYVQDGKERTLTIHWNGSTWQIAASPNITANDNSLYTVTALSKDNVWAFGYALDDGTDDVWKGKSLALHWDGTGWKVADTPLEFKAIYASGISPSKVMWIVGGDAQGSEWSAVRHPNDSQWQTIRIPNSEYGYGEDYVNVSVSDDDLWAVGSKWGDGPPSAGPNHGGEWALAMHWDGTQWGEVPAPNLWYTQALRGVAAVTKDEIWVVGRSWDSEDDAGHALIAHFVGCSSSDTK